jgi:UDP-GlcNAc:undecaprenyl-phosphate/decaprenyl-phosphate GlcNAc-1-phosphate transferase
MIITMMILPLIVKAAARWRFVDAPGERKVHSVPIPRAGGIAMAIGVLVTALLVVPLGSQERYFLIAAILVAACGGLDDRLDLDYRIKLGGQLAAAAIVIFCAHIKIHALTLDDRLALPDYLSVPLTFLFLVGITNAINLADGLDGLAGGTAFLILCALAILANSGGEFGTAALALTFAGAVLGFLRYNTYPASVFMGDAGSQLLGFAVGVLSLMATQNGTSVISAATPVLLLALPILDTLSVMAQRLSEGRSPFSADKNHIHHKLLALGFRHHEAVMVIYAVQADLFLLAFWMRYESDLAIIATVTAFFLAIIALLQAATRYRWRLRPQIETIEAARPEGSVAHVLDLDRAPKWAYSAVAIAVLLYALLIVVETARLSGDVRWLLTALLGVIVVWLSVLRIRPLSLIEKGTLYVTFAVLVYLDTEIVHERIWSILNWAAVLTAAAGTLLRLRRDRRFQLTPLDIIVLFVALVIPSLSSSIPLPAGTALGIAKLVILFYSIEVLVSRAEIPVVWFRIGVATILAGLIMHPML